MNSRGASRVAVIDLEQRRGVLEENGSREKDVALDRCFSQGEEESGLESLGGSAGMPVRRAIRSAVRKSDPEDFFREPIGVFANDVDGGGAIFAIGLDGDSGCDAVTGEKHHDLLDSAVLLP